MTSYSNFSFRWASDPENISVRALKIHNTGSSLAQLNLMMR